MNFKLLAATTLLFIVSSATAALSFSKEDWKIFMKEGNCVGCNLSNFDSSVGINNARGGVVYSFEGKDLKNRNFQEANFSNSYLKRTDFRNSNLSNTNLQNVKLQEADLRNANLKDANLRGANLCGADLRGVNWEGIIYNEQTECLPDEAIDYVHTARRTNNDSNYNNCPSVNSVSNTNSRSLKENVDEAKDITESVKGLINLF